MLQFRKNGGRAGTELWLQSACRVEIETVGEESGTRSGRLAAALKRGLAEGTFAGKEAVLSVQPGLLHSKSVRLPPMPDSDLQQALLWEAKDRFGFEIGEGRMVWFRAGEVRRGTEVKDELLLFAAESATLSAQLDAAAAAGLVVKAIDIAPCASYRSTCRAGFNQPLAGESLALLHIGHATSQFIITRNDQLVFFKHVEIGGETIDAAVAKKLGISQLEAAQMRARLGSSELAGEGAAPLQQALQDAIRPLMEELARELDMCMRYFVVTFRGARPDLIMVTGRQADCPRILENLANSLGMRAEAAAPLRGVSNLADIARPDRCGEWSVAAGLSLYPLTSPAKGAAA